MAYYMFLGTMQVPIPPESLTTTINNKNTTIDLLGKGEVNILKTPGLTEVSFKMLLPNSDYPFNESLLFKGRRANYYIDQLEKLKAGDSAMAMLGSVAGVEGLLDTRKFQFIVVRMKAGGEMLQMTNLPCTLEDYKIIEDAGEGYDCYADINLKQWKPYGTKKVELQTDANGNTVGTESTQRSIVNKPVNPTITPSKKTTLQRVLKKELGNTNNLFRIAKLNKIAVPGVLAAGQAINLYNNGGL